MTLRRRSRLFAVAGVALLCAALGPLRSNAAGDITVHVIAPLTGQEAFLGKSEKTALDIAERFVNARGGDPVHIVYHDDQSKPEVAVQLLAQLAADKVPVVVGPAGRGTCLALAPLVAKGPVNYCLSPTMHAEPGSYVFMTGVDTYDLDRAMVRFARLKGWKRIGIITSTDATGNDALHAYDLIFKEPENRGMTVVGREQFGTTDITVSAQLARIKAGQPDAIFAWSTGLGIDTVLKGMVQAGLDIPVATSFGNMTYARMKNWNDFMPKEVYFPTTAWPGRVDNRDIDPRVLAALREINAAFDAAHERPDAGANVAWDPFLLTVQVLRKLGPGASADQVRGALQSVSGYAGMNGLYDFKRNPQRGVGEQNAVVTAWVPERGTWEVVSKPSGIPLSTAGRR